MVRRWLPEGLAALRDIEAYEVEQALSTSKRWPRPTFGREGQPVLGIWARTNAGRPLIVAMRHEGNLDWLIVGARDMRPDERTEFEQWEAQR
jgi:hypothetical protein